MTNLPISVNAPQPNANANAASLAVPGLGAEDNGGERFAAMLARQFGELASGMPPGLSVAVDAAEAALAGAVTTEVALEADALSVQQPAADASAAVAGILAQIPQGTQGKIDAVGAEVASGDAAGMMVAANMPGLARGAATGAIAQNASSMSAVALQTAPGRREDAHGKPDAAPGSTISAAATARQPADGKAQADVFAASMRAAQASAGNTALVAPAAVTQQASAQAAQAAALATQSLQPAQAGVAAAMQQTISTPLGDKGWAGDFSQKIVWMGNQQNQVAELHLNPPDLGPLDVVLKVSDNQATALFTSPHAAVREAVEQALPRLRETLADNGITLGNATVSDQPPRERDMNGFAGRQDGGVHGDETGAASGTEQAVTESASARTMRRHDGMVDTFA